MAASDYRQTGEAVMCPVATLNGALALEVGPSTINVENFVEVVSRAEDVQVGDAILIDDEVLRIDDIEDWPELTVSRGCGDTIPQAHSDGATVWFFTGNSGNDAIEYASGDTVGVKLAPFSLSGGAVPLEYVPPFEVTFNWRFSRPYAPADFKVNGTPWFTGPKTTTPLDSGVEFTWANRNRLSQADQLVSHDEGNLTVEPGVTYTATVFDNTDTEVNEYTGITGTSWTYARADMITDLPGKIGYVIFRATRDGLDSLFTYRVNVRVQMSGLGLTLGQHLGGI